MGRLLYTAIGSLDGYLVDGEGRFDWAEPDEEVFAFVNELERPAGTHLYGRRMYETMAVWETMGTESERPVVRDFAAIWRAAEKIVYSRTLTEVASARTRIERELDPRALRRLKAATPRDLTIGGAELAAVALHAGLVDDCHLILAPIIVGSGRRILPDGLRADLTLVGERRFAGGMVHLHHRFAPR